MFYLRCLWWSKAKIYDSSLTKDVSFTVQYSTVNRQNSNVEAENESPHQGRAEASDTTSWYNQEMCRELGSQGG